MIDIFQNQPIKITSAARTRELLRGAGSILLYVNFPSQDIFVKLLGKLTVLASEEAFITNLVHVGGDNLRLESPREARTFFGVVEHQLRLNRLSEQEFTLTRDRI